MKRGKKMRKNHGGKKGCSIGILLLFFGVIFLPSITGSDDQSAYCVGLPPNPPTITGPHYGKTNTTYTFSLGVITNPDEDLLYGLWEWGDGSPGNWLGPYISGQSIDAIYSWSKPGNYTIRVKLKDTMDVESDWSAPFYIEIVELRPGLFLGSYKNFIGTDDLWVLQARFCIVVPSNSIVNRGDTIVISKDSRFYRGLRFIVGTGGVAVVDSVNSDAALQIQPAISFVSALAFLRGRMSNLSYENGAYGGTFMVFHAEDVHFTALALFGCSVFDHFVDKDVSIRYDSPPFGYIGARSFFIMFKTTVNGPI